MDHIHRLIAEGEHQRLDFKFEIADARKIARTLVAFANTDGGRLLIGIKDNGVVAGIRSDEEFYMAEAAAKIYCRPPVQFTFKEWNIGGKTVLEVTVPKSDHRPHFSETEEKAWKAYIRSGDQNFPANRILLRLWRQEKRPTGVSLRITEPEQFLLRYLETNASVTITEYARLAKISRSRAENILFRLLSMNLIGMQFGEAQVRYCSKPNTPS